MAGRVVHKPIVLANNGDFRANVGVTSQVVAQDGIGYWARTFQTQAAGFPFNHLADMTSPGLAYFMNLGEEGDSTVEIYFANGLNDFLWIEPGEQYTMRLKPFGVYGYASRVDGAADPKIYVCIFED